MGIEGKDPIVIGHMKDIEFWVWRALSCKTIWSNLQLKWNWSTCVEDN